MCENPWAAILRRCGRLAVLSVILLAAVFNTAIAHAEKRLALLISNQAYAQAVGPLENPHNDIALLKATLFRVGFAEADITVVSDAGRIAMLQAFDEFAAKVSRAGAEAISFFYYSGHGVANDRRENFLIPVDVGEVDTDVWYRSVSLCELLDRLNDAAPNARHFIVFDACRNTLKLRDARSRALIGPRGFEPVRNIPGGMLIAFSTAEGELASDEGQGAGPYATVLAQEIVKPGVEAVTVFRNTQLGVSARIGQRPWTQNGPIGETYFAGRDISQPSLSEAARAWQWVRNTMSEAVLRDFIRLHGDSGEADLARKRLDELRAASLLVRIPIIGCTEPSVLVPFNNIVAKCLKPGSGESVRDCWDVDGQQVCGPDMTVLPQGAFLMGSPKDEAGRLENEDDTPNAGGNPIAIRIDKPFAVARTHVTRGQFAAFVAAKSYKTDGGCYLWTGSGWKAEAKASWQRPGFNQDDKHPAVCLSWNDARAYVDWLNEKMPRGFYRLMTSAEAEYAARAVTQAAAQPRYFFGDSESELCAYANGYDETAQARFSEGGVVPCEDGHVFTAPVASFKPNGFGLFDVQGNVWTWALDCYYDSYRDTPLDGKAEKTVEGCRRVVRGGAWEGDPSKLRSASRAWVVPESRYNTVGVRIARTLPD